MKINSHGCSLLNTAHRGLCAAETTDVEPIWRQKCHSPTTLNGNDLGVNHREGTSKNLEIVA